MQANDASQAAAPQEPFLTQELGGKPFGLWCIWLIGIIAWFCLLMGMGIDEIGYSEYVIDGGVGSDGNSKEQCTCGSSTFTCLGGGFQDKQYSDQQSESIVFQQMQAGSGYLAFLIIAMIFSPICCFGFITDFFDGEYDSYKPSDFWLGCPGFCQPCGFSTYGMIVIPVWSMFGLLWYVLGETCSDVEFWEIFNNGVEDLSTIGGFSMALTILSMILFAAALGLVFFMKYSYDGVPTGSKIDIPIIGGFLENAKNGNSNNNNNNSGATGVPHFSPNSKPTNAPSSSSGGGSQPPKPPNVYNSSNSYNQSSKPPTKPKINSTGKPKPKLVDPALMSSSNGTSNNKPKGPPPRPGGPPPVPN